jgi:hypothetical protein
MVIARMASSPWASARVAAWSWAEGRRLNRALHDVGIDAVDGVGRAPDVAARHRPVVAGVMRVTGATCLVRSAMLQRWDADHGVSRPLVIGVARDESVVTAHAWLEGERHARFEELVRRPPKAVAGRAGADGAHA